MSNIYLLWGLVLVFTILEWVSVYRKWINVEYVSKPGVMVALLIWLIVTSGIGGGLLWFAIGIIFSLAGDVFLMLPSNWFIRGLIAFLLAHLSYIIGFNLPSPAFNLFILLPALLILLLDAWIYRKVSEGLQAKDQEKLKMPVLIYIVVISLMLLSAISTFWRLNWDSTTAILVSVGAFLFYISDAILAWNKFVTPIPNGRLMNIIAYHLGQLSLIAGVAIHFRGTM